MSTRIFAVRNGGEAPETLRPSVDELPALLADPEVVVWVDLDSQDRASQRLLEEVFEFHPLVVEDAFADATTPKLEDHGRFLYIIVHGLTDADPGDGEVETADLDLFLGERFLITHYRLPFAAVEETKRAVERDRALLARGPAVVAHRIIDVLVDEYLPLMKRFDAEVDGIEEAILGDSSPQLLERVFRMKHSLQRIRRIGLHQKGLLDRMARGELALVPEEVRPFFSDVYDHMVRVVDLNDVYRDLMTSSLDAYLGMQSHKLNEVMRILTVFSTVMLPLTFITGLYGMNFDYMPYLHFEYGFEVAIGVMVTIAVLMLVFFRRRRWI
ncbi:MAG TPA: magnesium/cobalt transporter CorA [Sandaracinaceae bacterium LLY-WYZ-13_1]|nr:magnesium/cobalt transporter CorA [Sandaracinaceae bacterium LLY-WYZ-13_1]